MVKYLIATHGGFAEGICSTISMVIGEQENLEWMNCYQDGERDIRERAEKTVESIREGDELIVCTDIFGGSVNNEFMRFIGKKGFHLVSGMNLPLMIALLLSPAETAGKKIEETLNQAREGIMYCNEIVVTSVEDEGF